MSDLPVRNVHAVSKPSGFHYLPSRDVCGCLGDVMNAWRTLFTGRVTFAIALDRSAAFNARIVDCASADAPQ